MYDISEFHGLFVKFTEYLYNSFKISLERNDLLLNILIEKLKEVLFSILPITLIVVILHFTIVPLETPVFLRFLVGAFLIIIGLSIFLFGVDIGISPIGSLMGSTIVKSNKFRVIVGGGLTLGFFISIAEPDLHILADQVAFVTSGTISKMSLVVVVSVGIAVLLTAGFLRIVYNKALNRTFTILYLLIFILALFSSQEFLAIAFDASGATTGAMTVPFVLALALGISSMKKNGRQSEEDSFGLVGIISAGAILAVLIMGILSGQDKLTGSLDYSITQSASILAPFFHALPHITWEVFLALFPIFLLFLIFQKISFHQTRKAFFRICKGLVYTFVGLILFLTGVNAGFMDVGSLVGYRLASTGNNWLVVLVGFLLGLVTILAEPAVHILTHQIEDVTSGYVKRKAVLFALSIGVGAAVALSMVRILIPEIKLWHYLLPGYIISLALSYRVPNLFVGMAFDSGGVASGPMTATFILAFAQGAAEYTEHANVLIDGFGVIAMVAMTPLIALQILGLIFQIKSRKEGVKAHE